MRASVKLTLIFFILSSSFASAQQNKADTFSINAPLGVVNSVLSFPEAGMIADWQVNSTAFTNSFLSDVRSDLVFTRQSVDNSAKKLNKNNYFINQFEGGFYFVSPLKKFSNTSMIYELSLVTFQEANFTKDAYELILYGNANFRNQTKNIGKLYFKDLEYQRIGLGMRRYFDAKKQVINVTANFIIGDYANEVKVSRGSVFTEQNGEYLDVDLAYEKRTSAAGARIYRPRGYGASINVNWTKYLVKQNATFSIDYRNLGFIHYGSKTEYQTVDTTIHYTGVDLGTLSSPSSFNSANLKDSVLKNFNLKNGFESVNFSLPAYLEIRYEKAYKTKSLIQVQIGAYLYNPIPTVKAGYLYRIKNTLYLGADMRAGGYSKFDLDLLVRYKTSNVLLDASVRSIEGIINPKNSSGLGFYLHLGYYLKQKNNRLITPHF